MTITFALAILPVFAESSTSGTTSVTSTDTQQSESLLTSDIENQLQNLDRTALLELVRLAEFNVRYQQTVNHSARWRALIYPALQESAYACYLGYNVNDIRQESKGWNNPGRISKTSVKAGLSSALVGASLGAGSSMMELAANGCENIRARREGFSGAAAAKKVKAALEAFDQLLAQRHSLMLQGSFTGTKKELLELKEELLKFERERLVFEFVRWNAHARGYSWYKNSFYVINATVNMARLTAVILGLKSFSSKGYAGAVGPLLISSATLAGSGPIASSSIGNKIQKRQEKRLAKQFPTTRLLSDAEAAKKMDRLAELLSDQEANNNHKPILAELLRLREEKIGLDRLIFHEEKHIQRFRLVAGQQAKTAPLISSFGVASGILNTVGYYGYRNNPIINNRLGFAGDASIITAEAVALYATPASAIKGELYERSLKKKGEHPTQLLAKRLADLVVLEGVLRDNPP